MWQSRGKCKCIAQHCRGMGKGAARFGLSGESGPKERQECMDRVPRGALASPSEP